MFSLAYFSVLPWVVISKTGQEATYHFPSFPMIIGKKIFSLFKYYNTKIKKRNNPKYNFRVFCIFVCFRLFIKSIRIYQY
jgi:hypothetical protein